MISEINALLQKTVSSVDENNRSDAEKYLDEIFRLEPTCLEAHNLREKYRLKGNYSDWIGVNAQISSDDDIFRFFANHPTSFNPIRDYLSDGWRTMVELEDVLDYCDLSLRRCSSFLEFACGQGRFTRHLARIFKKEQLTVSDVVPGSVGFLQETMGVKGFYSSNDPDSVKIPEKYEVIFVLSLFSHLPPTVWHQWLKVLYDSLKPNGVLIFSTHGEKCARMVGISLDDKGVKFFPSSESTVLDGETYGCTYAAIDFVHQAITDALGATVKVKSIPEHFWGNQDAIVVLKQ
jgi:SAM-dependent methyltransferase